MNMILAWLLGLVVSSAQPAAREMREIKLPSGTTLRYAAVLPDGHKADVALPVLVALAPGASGPDMIDVSLARYWEATAKARGWCVLSPAPPAGATLLDAAALLGEFIDAVPSIVTPAGQVHLAGVSNGGRAAVRLAALRPGAFASLLLLPGIPGEASDWERLESIGTLPVMAYVGENDQVAWVEGSREMHRRLRAAGGVCTLEVLSGQAHVLDIAPATLFDWMESVRSGSAITLAQRAEARLAIEAVLNDFHDAAAKADKARYMAHFAPGAVFIGTDASERWSVEEFRVFVSKYFDQGKGWTYTPRERWITVADDGVAAWFDERLDNAKLGACRGSGVLVLRGGRWRVAQYNLTVPVPNDLMGEVVDLIRRKAAPPAKESPR